MSEKPGLATVAIQYALAIPVFAAAMLLFVLVCIGWGPDKAFKVLGDPPFED